MLSDSQRSKIRTVLSDIADELDLTFLEERQQIENSDNVSDPLDIFPLVQVTFLTEGKRQRYWREKIHEYQDPQTGEWQTIYGHIAQASISISIRSTDVDELHTKSVAFDIALWKSACNWTLEQDPPIEFRGNDPPRFLPPYLALDNRTNIYSCVIDFHVDYEFSWPIYDPPITHFVVDTNVGLIDGDMKSIGELNAVAPGSYVMSGMIYGDGAIYRMSGVLD
jgi:hypothetical protein